MSIIDERERAERRGPLCGRAWHELSLIRTCSDMLARDGQPVPALSPAAMKLLEKAVRGQPVDVVTLDEVVTAAEALTDQLVWAVLRRFPGGV